MTDLFPNLVAAAVYALLGIVLFVASFLAVDWLSPASLWKEIIEEHNLALAVLMGALAVAMAIVIAAAIV